MGEVKRYLMYSVLLFFYVVALSVLLKQYTVFVRAYRVLGAGIEHASIEIVDEPEEETNQQ